MKCDAFIITGTKIKPYWRQQQKQQQQGKAKLVLTSHSAQPSQKLLVPRYQVSAPAVVRLDEERDLGGWESSSVVRSGSGGDGDGGDVRGV